MRTVILSFCLFVLLWPRLSAATELEAFAPGPGGEPPDIDREVVWLDNPDPAGDLGSSEIIAEYDLESEIANDFLIEVETTICRITWWGGYWNGEPIQDPAGPFFATIYDNDDCEPSDTLHEFIIPGDANQTPFDGYSLFTYWIDVEIEFAPGHYWLSAQLEHPFPPQWGRLGADQVRECDSMFRSVYFSYPDWMPAGEWWPWDASQMLEDDCGATAIETATWGRVKRLYR